MCQVVTPAGVEVSPQQHHIIRSFVRSFVLIDRTEIRDMPARAIFCGDELGKNDRVTTTSD
jgi:hypothetical protein